MGTNKDIESLLQKIEYRTFKHEKNNGIKYTFGLLLRNNNRKLRLCFILSFTSTILLAQNYALDLQRSISPSPTATAMAKYGNIPVSPYTGMQNISIPLYSVKLQDLNLPISLNYHGGGIKVSEEASWVGLGWTIEGPGVITRVVHGLDDLPSGSSRGYPDSYLPISIDPSTNKYSAPQDNNTEQQDLNFLREVANGNQDGEPDIFIFNFNGRSGKFILNKRSTPSAPLTPMLISQADLKIEPIYNSTTHKYRWIITDEEGIKYYFGTIEKSISRSGMGEDEETADNNSLEGPSSIIASSWYIDSIISPKGDKINFNYLTSNGAGTRKVFSRSQIKKHILELYASQDCTIPPMNELIFISNYTEVQDIYLRNIEFPNGRISFTLSNREDIEPAQIGTNADYAKKIDKIMVYSKSGSTYSATKTIEFNYSYFNPETGPLGERLKLLNIREYNGQDSLNPYLFEYNEVALPLKDSKSIDHWGYYNGAENERVIDPLFSYLHKGTLIPPATVYFPQTNQTKNLVGADRKPNLNKTKAGMLTSITYPTKGKTTFQYELNDYYAPAQHIDSTGSDIYLEKWGPGTGIPNPRQDTFTLTLLQPSLVKINTAVQCYHSGAPSKACLLPGSEYEYDVANIKSLPGTQTLNKWIGYKLNYENQDQGDLEETQIYLPAGKYKCTVYADQSYVSRLIIDWYIKDTTYTKNAYAGGLRVQSIKTFDGNNHANDQISRFFYRNPEDTTQSSGKLMDEPVYSYRASRITSCHNAGHHITSKRIVRYSSPLTPFSYSALGNSIGYSYVGEIKNETNKIVYEYLNKEDFVSYPEFPNVPTIGFIGNGLLTKVTYYSKVSAKLFNKVKEDSMWYDIDYNRTKSIKGMVIPNGDAVFYTQNSALFPTFNNVKFYDVESQWIHLSRKTTIAYNQNNPNSYTSITTRFFYENPNWLQLTKKSLITSDGKIKETHYKYPYDYFISGTPNNNAARGIQKLQSLHIINPVIEQYNLKSDANGANFKAINAQLITFKADAPLPDTIFTLDIYKPISGFTPTEITSSKITKNDNYIPKILVDEFDKNYNITQQHKPGNSNEVYLWGYKGQYPVVKVVGSGYSVVKNHISSAMLDSAANYSDVQIRTELNKIRIKLNLENAQVYTYTYSPLIGITSETNAKGKTIYYEYDDLGRLKFTKDQDGKILKKNDYSYATFKP